jgi:hypothetical protein
MEPTGSQVFVYFGREKRTRPNSDDFCRPDLDSNHACWPAASAPSWWWHVWSDPHPLETGMVTVLFCRP